MIYKVITILSYCLKYMFGKGSPHIPNQIIFFRER